MIGQTVDNPEKANTQISTWIKTEQVSLLKAVPVITSFDGAMTFGTMTLSIMTSSITITNGAISIARYWYLMLSVVMLTVVTFIIPNVVMLNVVILSVVMLSVVTPFWQYKLKQIVYCYFWFYFTLDWFFDLIRRFKFTNWSITNY